MTLLHLTDPLLSRASGSVGPTVFSRNQHGTYTKPRVTPTDPNTALQIVVRSALATLTTRWRDTLTAAQRRSWDLYAVQVHLRNRIARVHNIGGLAMFVRSNVPRIQANEPTLAIVDQAPNLLNLPSFTPITRIVLNIVDDTIHPFFDPTDAWAQTTAAALLFYASQPQPLTVNFFRGPYRFAASLIGQTAPPLITPATIPLPFPAGASQRVFIRARLTAEDARLTHSFRIPADIVPQVAPLPLAARIFPPPPFTVVVTFDSLLRVETHATANWFLRFGNQQLGVTKVSTNTTDLTQLLITTSARVPNPGPNTCVYTPPPSDVNGLLTGIPVASFTLPLTT